MQPRMGMTPMPMPRVDKHKRWQSRPGRIVPYRATLVCSNGSEQVQRFGRLLDAILWLTDQLRAGRGASVYGEIHDGIKLLWRQGKRPVRS